MPAKRDRGGDDSGDEIEYQDEEVAGYDDVADDEPEVFSDEEEENRGKPRKKKKRKTAASMLIDEEAEEDDDLDDEDDDDDDGGVGGLIADGSDEEPSRDAARDAARAQQLRRQQDLSREDARDVVRRIEERWARKEFDDGDEEGGALAADAVDQQGLQPTIRDPRLFILRCRKPGYERRAILSLLQKMFDLRKRGVDIGIISAVAPEHLKGLLYIEAYSSSQVESAVRGLDLITSYGGIKPVALDEMTDVLQVGRRLDKQEKGNWVRLKRGLYKGDLAQVYDVPEGGKDPQIMVRLIPRLRFKREGDDDVHDDDDIGEDEDADFDDDPGLALGKSNKRLKRRPPPKLFDATEAGRLYSALDNRVFQQRDQYTGDIFDHWNNDLFRLGLLYKRVSVKTLLLNDAVVPTPDELEMWAAAETRIKILFKDPSTTHMVENRDVEEGLFLQQANLKSKKKTAIFKGDTVEIVQGEQKGFVGTVAGFDGGMVLIQDSSSSVPVRAARADVVKSFRVGDHVKVTAGKKAGYSGVIVSITGESLVIFTDSTREEIRVTSHQVSDSKDLAAEQLDSSVMGAGGKQIGLFELVFPIQDRDAKGVVVGLHGDRVSILNAQNMVQEHPVRDVRHVPRDAFNQAHDVRGHKLTKNIALHVTSGPLKDRSGVIVEVSGKTVFFKGNDEVRNCGVLAVLSTECEAQAAAARTMDQNGEFKVPAPIPQGALPTLSGGRGGFMKGGGRGSFGGRVRDDLRDKDVKITKGPYKGHLGKVVDTNEKTVRVELQSKMKVVTLSRDKVRDLSAPRDGEPTSGGGGDSGRRPNSGGFSGSGAFSAFGSGVTNSGARTPSRPAQDGAQGARTPYGGRTPVNLGSRTPMGSSFGSFGSRTPSHMGYNNPGSRTPAHGGLGGTTPRGNGMGTQAPRTPMHTGAFRPTTPARADEYGTFGSFGSSNRGPSTTAAAARSANPYAGFNNGLPNTPGTPMMPVTPAGGGYGGQNMDPTTPSDPALIPQTPVEPYMIPQTPQMEPQTPQMQFEPQTPQPYAEANTPGGPMVPQTPATPEPSTPMPETPGPAEEPSTPAPAADEQATATLGFKVLIDVVVSVPSLGGRSGVVLDAAYDGHYLSVRMLDITTEVHQLNGQEFTPVQPGIVPGAENLVKVLDGPYVGRVGRLTSMTNDQTPQGRIDFGSGIEMLDMAFVAKYQKS